MLVTMGSTNHGGGGAANLTSNQFYPNQLDKSNLKTNDYGSTGGVSNTKDNK